MNKPRRTPDEHFSELPEFPYEAHYIEGLSGAAGLRMHYLDVSASLPMMLYRALCRVMPRFRVIFAELGLTDPQWRVLRVLRERSDIALGDLAELTLIPAPSLVGVVDRLSHNGLVERRRSAADRRSVAISATSAGLALEARVMPAVEQAYAELRASIADDTWRELNEGLAALAATAGPEPD